mmetsp:Transcript_22071/g.19639  ORF Transcript_22071/g.19639 Transcript_22071/m.19639 type:complete len:129 (+) Transcript_22071:235-621(+)
MKEIKSLTDRIAFRSSENMPHHLGLEFKRQEDKIKELKQEISSLQDLRIDNDILRTKMKQMQTKNLDMRLEIKQFDYSKTVARKVERDKQVFLDQLIKKKRSTDPADSSHYVHITKYHKLKDEMIAEK